MATRIISMVLGLWSMCAVLTPAAVPAADRQEAPDQIILSLQDDVLAADPDGSLEPLTTDTLLLLDRLHAALAAGSTADITGAVNEYTATIGELQSEQFNLTCILPLLLSLFSSSTSILNAAAAGGDQTCQFLRITNSAADIVSAIQTYRICMIDSAETPDQTLRQQIVRRQVVVKTYNFITSALYTGYCKVAPTFFDWFNVVLDFLAIFPKEQPEETP